MDDFSELRRLLATDPNESDSERITGQAWLNDDVVLLRSDLDPVVVTRTVLHEGRHLADVKLLGLPYINANRKYSEQRAAEYEEAHWRGLMY